MSQYKTNTFVVAAFWLDLEYKIVIYNGDSLNPKPKLILNVSINDKGFFFFFSFFFLDGYGLILYS